jgi:hypothetical protein
MDINFFDESTEKFIAALDAVTIAKVLRTLDFTCRIWLQTRNAS